MDIDIKALRVFVQVMKDETFSAAARTLKITQPTVSQQIAKLEAEMQTRLFERVGHDIVPTPSAYELMRFGENILDQFENFTDSYKAERSQPKGLVRYAMPESCQWTPHFKKIMKDLPLFPEIQFQIEVLDNEQITDGILEGKFDFGFVTGEKLAADLRFEKFSDEKYSAVATAKDIFKAGRLISYPGWELFFTTWAKAHGVLGQLKSQMQQPTVHIGTLAGAIHAVKEGVGYAVIPTHCLFEELGTGELVENLPKRGETASCPIYLARKVGAKPPRRVEHVLEMLRTAKKDLG